MKLKKLLYILGGVLLAIFIFIAGVAVHTYYSVRDFDQKAREAIPVGKTYFLEENCGTEDGVVDKAVRSCFLTGYNEGEYRFFTSTQYTIEGDPIVTTYEIARGTGAPLVKVTTDASQDRFGAGAVHEQTCMLKYIGQEAVFALEQCS